MQEKLSKLFNAASAAAQGYDGSEASYERFFKLAIAFDNAANDNDGTNLLLDQAIEALGKQGDFLETLKNGGAQIFHHGAVFIRPNPDIGIEPGEGKSEIEEAVHEPRLKEVVLALQTRGIYFDDLVIDIGGLRPNQMREYPYVIITIPRLNAQIAVADQKGEAIFAVRPALEFMNWALFEKPMAGKEGTPFENVQRVVHAGAWQERLMKIVLSEHPPAIMPEKIKLSEYIKEKRKSKYPLTDEMVAKMARMVRDRDPEKQWQTFDSAEIPHDIVVAVTGDENWQKETWKAIDQAGRNKYRGLTQSLSQILKAQGCHYDWTEEKVAKMARMVHDRDPDKQWPSCETGEIPHNIVVAVTGDENWQTETWKAIDSAGRKKSRGLTQSLSQILKAQGCHHDWTEEKVAKMARMVRDRDPDKQWPSVRSGEIPHDIVIAVTGDKNWQKETWKAINGAGTTKSRGLTQSLSQILKAQGCHYDWTKEKVAKMARMYRDRHPQKQWPSSISGEIPHDIVVAVTGDKNWQKETWSAINLAGARKSRGLKLSLKQILDAHCPERTQTPSTPELV